MRAVWKRTLTRLLRAPGAWLYIALCTLTGALMTCLYALTTGYPEPQTVFPAMLLAQAICTPVLVMDAFAADHRAHTARLLAALPLTRAQIASGKCAAYACVSALAALFSAIAPVATEYALGFRTCAAAVCAIGSVFCATTVTVGCFCLVARIKRRLIAVFSCYLWIAAGYCAPIFAEALAGAAWGVVLGRALLCVSPFARFAPFLSGILDLRAIMTMLAVGALAITLSSPRGAKTTLGALFACALMCFLITLQPAPLTRLDMTEGRLITPSTGMLDAVATLEEAVEITLVATPGAEDPWIDAYLEALDAKSRALRYRVVAPVEDAEINAVYTGAPMLAAQAGQDFVWLDAQACYAAYENQHTFEIEGVVLTLLGEATGQALLDTAEITGKDLSRTGANTADRGASVAIGCVGTLIPLGVCIWRKRRYL